MSNLDMTNPAAVAKPHSKGAFSDLFLQFGVLWALLILLVLWRSHLRLRPSLLCLTLGLEVGIVA